MVGNINHKIKKAVSPYIKESKVSFIIAIAVLILVFAVCLFALEDKIEALLLSLCIVVVFLLIDYLLNYQLGINAFIDAKKMNIITRKVELVDIKRELQFSGRYESLISKFYSRDMHISRYLIICKDAEDNICKFRTTMSLERYSNFYKLLKMKGQIDKFNITYLKRSKIIIWMELTGELTSKELSKKQIEEINGFLKTINSRI
jgi:hypothetical protein